MRTAPRATDLSVHLINRLVDERLRSALQQRAGLGPLNGRGFADQIGYSRAFNDPVIPGSSSIGDISPPNNLTEDGDAVISGGLGVEPFGVDYGSWPLQMQQFNQANARLANLDYFVGIPFVTRLRGSMNDGGHLHRGLDGDGPPIPVSSVVLPTGMTLKQYLGISDTTGVAPPPTGVNDTPPPFAPGGERFAIWDDFETDDQEIRWQVAFGAVERRQDANGNWRWFLPTGSLIRVKSPGFSFNDRVTIRLDVKWDLGNDQRTLDVRVRSRVGTSGFSYVAGFSCTEHCYIGELDYSTGILNILEPLPSDFQIANDSQVRTMEVMVQGTDMQIGTTAGTSEGQEMAVTLSRDDSGEEGYIEIYVPPDSAGAYIDNFLLARGSLAMVQRHASTHHAAGIDQLDIKDLADSLSLLHTPVPGIHGATHETGGNDVLDISLLADASGVRLTRSQYETLTQNGDASLYHRHNNIAPVDPVSMPKLVVLGETPGVSTLSSPADHTHRLPAWKMQGYVDAGIGPGHMPDDADFRVGDPVIVSYVPTMGGEFSWVGAGNGFVWRAWIAIQNSALTDYNITLLVPVLVDMTLRVRVKNESDGDLLLQTYEETDYTLNAEIPFRLPADEITTIVLYGAGSGSGLKFAQVQTKENDGDLFGLAKSLAWTPVELALSP